MKNLWTVVALSLLLSTEALVPNQQLERTSSSSAFEPITKLTRRFALQTAVASVLALSSSAASPARATTASSPKKAGGAVRYGDESIMKPKQHGTSNQPVQSQLLYGVDTQLADRICCYNRQLAERAGYFQTSDLESILKQQQQDTQQPITFYDSVTGKPLFVAPVHRSLDEFWTESKIHGWPSFRDDEVVWDNVRVLRFSGETVSVDGTHLGHNLPDAKGNRYCINLVSIAGKPV